MLLLAASRPFRGAFFTSPLNQRVSSIIRPLLPNPFHIGPFSRVRPALRSIMSLDSLLKAPAQSGNSNSEFVDAGSTISSPHFPVPKLSQRILATDEPVIIQMRDLIEGATDVMSLAQGIVYWQPPEAALERAKEVASNPEVSGYGIDDGMPKLRQALVEKVREENGLCNSAVMVTHGAQQAFLNAVLATCDPEDTVTLFPPYYFNHLMAFQMTGTSRILYGQSDPDTLQPDPVWVESALEGKFGPVPKVMVLVNPGNPTGAMIPGPLLQRISAACREAGTWLIVDNTYEYFMYDGKLHTCVEGPHVINIFSFSKAYGMMGWRVGYIAYPAVPGVLAEALLKVQDTVPICANLVAQEVAMAAVSIDPARTWVKRNIQTLLANRELARDALSSLGEGAVRGGEAGIFVWAKLPQAFSDDRLVVKWLVERHGVCIIPGSASGGPGCVRVSFGNLDNEKYREAAGRLRRGLEELVTKGLVQGPRVR